MGRLDDKIAMVTGASRGLGEGIARRFADEGAAVVCADVLDASEVASSLPAAPSGAQPMAIHLDVTDTAQVEAQMRSVAETYGRLDILANNAGVPRGRCSHNMAQARRASEETVFMLIGKVIEHGLTEDIFLNPQHRQTADYIEGRYG